MDVYSKILPIAILEFKRFWRHIGLFFFSSYSSFFFPLFLVIPPKAVLLWEDFLVRCDLHYILNYVKFSFQSQEPSTGNTFEYLNMGSIHLNIFNKQSCTGGSWIDASI